MTALPETMIDIIGWTGAAAYVAAYGLLSVGWLKSDRINYHALNALGGVCLVITSYNKSDAPNFFVNLFWCFIAVVSMARLLNVKR